MRVHRPARRQRASTRTWPPGAVAWSELVIWRCSLVFRLVIAAMTLHHHTGDVVSTDSSPKDAFLLSRLTIREPRDSTFASGRGLRHAAGRDGRLDSRLHIYPSCAD